MGHAYGLLVPLGLEEGHELLVAVHVDHCRSHLSQHMLQFEHPATVWFGGMMPYATTTGKRGNVWNKTVAPLVRGRTETELKI